MINACYDGTIIAINNWTDQRIVHWEGLYGEKITNVESTLTLPISFSKANSSDVSSIRLDLSVEEIKTQKNYFANLLTNKQIKVIIKILYILIFIIIIKILIIQRCQTYQSKL